MFDERLARLLADKIEKNYTNFSSENFIKNISEKISGKKYSERMQIFAEELKNFLPNDFPKSAEILEKILGDENPNQTGMISVFYWVLPIGKFVEMFGLDDFEASMHLIEKITKRSTAEFAIRPFIEKYPTETLEIMGKWAKSDNFHLRRLASEGLRPKLPWGKKLTIFIDNPESVFAILENLKEDSILYVKKSVANHLTDWIKVNPDAVKPLLQKWAKSENANTKWILKRATRKFENFLK